MCVDFPNVCISFFMRKCQPPGSTITAGQLSAVFPGQYKCFALKSDQNDGLLCAVVVIEVETQQQLMQVGLVAAHRQFVHH